MQQLAISIRLAQDKQLLKLVLTLKLIITPKLKKKSYRAFYVKEIQMDCLPVLSTECISIHSKTGQPHLPTVVSKFSISCFLA